MLAVKFQSLLNFRLVRVLSGALRERERLLLNFFSFVKTSVFGQRRRDGIQNHRRRTAGNFFGPTGERERQPAIATGRIFIRRKNARGENQRG